MSVDEKTKSITIFRKNRRIMPKLFWQPSQDFTGFVDDSLENTWVTRPVS